MCIQCALLISSVHAYVETVVTNDHTFFRAFAQSSVAENILLSQVEALVNAAQKCVNKAGREATHPPLRVKLAGEIIPGLLGTAITNNSQKSANSTGLCKATLASCDACMHDG